MKRRVVLSDKLRMESGINQASIENQSFCAIIDHYGNERKKIKLLINQ